MSIRFENVSKSFGNKTVLRDVSFEVETGEILFIIGKSGMGKSVLLKQIIGLMKPCKGRVFVDQKHIASLNPTELAQTRKLCGMIFQHPALLDSLDILANTAFGLNSIAMRAGLKCGQSKLFDEEIKTIVLKKLALVHLGPEVLDRYPPELSYGMQKRVSLARTLVHEPKYLLFDEPTTGLDPITTNAVNDLIFELSRKLKVTSVVVSHDMAGALKTADRILVLDQSKILAHGTVEQIQESKEPLIQAFLSETLPRKHFRKSTSTEGGSN